MKQNNKLLISLIVIFIGFILSLAMIITGSVFLGIYYPDFIHDIHNYIFNYVLSGSILLGLGLFNLLTILIILFIYSFNNKNSIKKIFKNKFKVGVKNAN